MTRRKQATTNLKAHTVERNARASLHSGFEWALYDLNTRLPRLYWTRVDGHIEGRAVPPTSPDAPRQPPVVILRPVFEGAQWVAEMMGVKNQSTSQFPHRAVVKVFRLVNERIDARIDAAHKAVQDAEGERRAFKVMESSLLFVKPRPGAKPKADAIPSAPAPVSKPKRRAPAPAKTKHIPTPKPPPPPPEPPPFDLPPMPDYKFNAPSTEPTHDRNET